MRLHHGHQATGPTGDGSVIVRKGGSGCPLVRGQGCKLTGHPGCLASQKICAARSG
jgi:hypothetical protein